MITKQIKLIQDEYNLLLIDKQLKITFNDNDIERICRYIKEYGTGGAQTQFLNIFRNYLPCL